jgi:NAD-dependent deacetylase
MKKLVVLTGAGISAESGFKTFRDSGGLWEQHPVEDVATPEGWARDYKNVLEFYNGLRKLLPTAQPNAGHLGLVDLENFFEVTVITQNVDDLHERAGSRNIIHLHGELTKAQSTFDASLIYDIQYNDILPGDKCEKHSQLRPYIVWFGEAVPMISVAADFVEQADIFVVIGSSLVVYPAAGLIDYVSPGVPIFVIDPQEVSAPNHRDITFIKEKAGTGVVKLKEMLKKLA